MTDHGRHETETEMQIDNEMQIFVCVCVRALHTHTHVCVGGIRTYVIKAPQILLAQAPRKA